MNVIIFQEPLEQFRRSRGDPVAGIEFTVAHEIARALGMSDAELDDLGA